MKLAWQSKEVGKPRWIVTSTDPDSKIVLVTSALEKQVPSTGIFSELGVAVNLYLRWRYDLIKIVWDRYQLTWG